MKMFVLLLGLVFSVSGYYLNATIPWTTSLSTPSDVDISIVANGKYYIADTTNNVIQVMTISSLTMDAPISGFGGGASAHAGPNGIWYVASTNELWVGDANSNVQVVSLSTNKIVDTISTGGTAACDELGWDATNDVVCVANPDDTPPFLTFIDVKTRTIVKNVTLSGSKVEQPLWNSVDGNWYISCPETPTNADGGIKVLSPTTFAETNEIAEPNCGSRGLAFAKDGKALLMACSDTNPLHLHTLVIDVTTADTIYDIDGVVEGDEVAYDPTTNTFFATGYYTDDLLHSVLASINNANGDLETVETGGTISHSVAVDSATGIVFVPLPDGIGIYRSESSSLFVFFPLFILALTNYFM